MGLTVSSFEALTLLPPNEESFKCFYCSNGVYSKTKQNLETVSDLAAEYYSADVGYRKTEKSQQLGFRLGFFWFPVTKVQVNRMLKKYGYQLGTKYDSSQIGRK